MKFTIVVLGVLLAVGISNGMTIRSETVKYGQCPDTTGWIGICVEGCNSDGDCPGNKKCCSNGCGHVCMTVAVKKPAPKLDVLQFSNDDKSWEMYKTKFNKVYASSDEEQIRKLNWKNSIDEANKHNALYAQGFHSWTKGVNQFSDGTQPGKGYKPTSSYKRPNIAPEFFDAVQNQRLGEPKVNEVEFYEASNKSWEDYKFKFKKNYTKEEEPLRRSAWEESTNTVNLHNSQYMVGRQSYIQGINQFSDGTKPSLGLIQRKPFISLKEIEFYLSTDKAWEEYKTKFNKNYTKTEEPLRRAAWQNCTAVVNQHNVEYMAGNHTYTQGINQFSDGTTPMKGLRFFPFGLLAQPHIERNKNKNITDFKADDKAWLDYRVKYNKVYSKDEEQSRRYLWEMSVKEVNQHNRGFQQGIYSYSKEVNQFSDGTLPPMGLMRPNIAPQFSINLTDSTLEVSNEGEKVELTLNPAVFNPEPKARLPFESMRPNIAPQFFDDLQRKRLNATEVSEKKSAYDDGEASAVLNEAVLNIQPGTEHGALRPNIAPQFRDQVKFPDFSGVDTRNEPFRPNNRRPNIAPEFSDAVQDQRFREPVLGEAVLNIQQGNEDENDDEDSVDFENEHESDFEDEDESDDEDSVDFKN